MCSIPLDNSLPGPTVLTEWEEQLFWDAASLSEAGEDESVADADALTLDGVGTGGAGPDAAGLRVAMTPWQRLVQVIPWDEQPDDHDAADCPAGACCDPDGWVPAEASLVMGLSKRQVGSRLTTAEQCGRYPATAAVMAQGRLQVWTASVLLEHLDALAAYLDPVELVEVESAALGWLAARPRTVAALNARMRRVLVAAGAAYEAAHAADADAQPGSRGAVEADRRVAISPARTVGMSELVALLPEADALAVHATLTALAGVRSQVGDSRTAPQRRADLLVTLVTGLPSREGRPSDLDHAVRADGSLTLQLDVSLPVTALHEPAGSSPGCSGSPAPAHAPGGVADAPGYGPVPSGTVRDLAIAATTCAGRPLVIDPATGGLLGFASRPVPLTWLADLAPGRGYQHPPTLDLAIRLRDRSCRAPGCRRAAARCDCDHVVPYPSGATSLGNSCCLCRRHHRLKTHAPGWQVTVGENGDLTWTTPAGVTTTTQPHDYRPPLVGQRTGPDEPDPPPLRRRGAYSTRCHPDSPVKYGA